MTAPAPSRFALIAPAEAAELPPAEAPSRKPRTIEDLISAAHMPSSPTNDDRRSEDGVGANLCPGRRVLAAGQCAAGSVARRAPRQCRGDGRIGQRDRDCIACGSAPSRVRSKRTGCWRASSTAVIPGRASSATEACAATGSNGDGNDHEGAFHSCFAGGVVCRRPCRSARCRDPPRRGEGQGHRRCSDPAGGRGGSADDRHRHRGDARDHPRGRNRRGSARQGGRRAHAARFDGQDDDGLHCLQYAEGREGQA